MKRLLFLFISFLFTSSTFAGPSTSGGTDDRQYGDTAAWFVGDEQTIQVCYEIAKDFPVAEQEIRSNISEVFSIWRDYMDSRKLNPYLRPSSKIDFQSCDGTQDLKFYFGVVNSETEKAKQNFSNPFGFAYKISYDSVKARGKGIIWIAPNGSIRPNVPEWSVYDRLKGILLHEVGHVLGNDHVSGTIMDAALAIDLSTQPSINTVESMSLVDHDRQLLMCKTCQSFQQSFHTGYSPEMVFKKLFGRNAVGVVSSSLRFVSDDQTQMILVFTDNISTNELPLALKSCLGQQIDPTNIFMSVMDGTAHSGFGGMIYHSMSEVDLGELTLPTGPMQITVNWNQGNNEATSVRTLNGDWLFESANIP